SSLATTSALTAHDGKLDTVDGIVDNILVDTNELQTNQGNWLTATGFSTHSASDVVDNFETQSQADPTGFHVNAMEIESVDATTQLDAHNGSGTSNPNMLLEAEIATVSTQTSFTLATGSTVDDAYNDQAIVLYDDSNSDYPSVRVITNYVGATKTVTLDSAADFTLGADDSVKVFVTAPGTAAPTVGQIRTEMDDNSTKLASILTDTTEIGAAGAGLTEAGGTGDQLTAINLPNQTMDITGSVSGSVGSVSASVTTDTASRTASKADVSALATDANQTSILSGLTDIKGATFSGSTDSLEAVRNRGDAAWTTGAGGTAPTVMEIRTEMDNNSTQFAALVSRLTAARAGYLDKLNVSGTLANTSTASTYKADVSALATAAALTVVDTVVDAIKLKTDNLPSDPADQSLLTASIAALNDITVAEIIAGITEGGSGLDLQEMLRIMFSVMAGHSSGGNTVTATHKDSTNTKSRTIATVDVNGNRTPTSYDGS
ncbi:MAG: hypothetical protein GY861_24565, partial [bacterium]|nr:hypothetical protein [bacterium]